MSNDTPKLRLVGSEPQPTEETEAPTTLDVIPTVITHAVKVIHPIFQDPSTGQPLPPPDNHEFRVGMQVSITTKNRVVVEGPAIFFASGNSPEEIADVIRNVVLEGLKEIAAKESVIKVAPESALDALSKFETPE